ncbi:AGE family epimerase/isomerase [uncultured Sphaerochaeta sp.]|uniref:AGE family epimerase/isomerase n=1 Tax=uncultured Sphaerochaeta sp. TaxID=886478 RepID=UPI002A0A7837|nr:AGE family epimerase/isomerase [uncultured Sphaerochaeta sp.]
MDKTFNSMSDEYKKMLVDNVLPFWLEHGFDHVNGGLYTGLDRDGSLLETDKSVWFQGRALWVFATAYDTMEKREVYKQVCDSLVSFIEDHCFDPEDGRMYFRVTAEGKPVIKRLRYIFSETFAILGFAAYGKAFGKSEYANKAYTLFKRVLVMLQTPGLLVPKFNQENAPSKGFGVPMILLNTAQELRQACPDHAQELTTFIDGLLKEITTYFVRPERKLVVEQCAPDGTLQLDHIEGRMLNPGHAIEGSWFIMREAKYRNNDAALIKLGTTMLDWMWEIGWDKEYGGIIYFRDVLGKSGSEYWQDMKFWWPQCEASIANLMAYSLTGNETYLENFKLVDTYVKNHFLDNEEGEWYGYLHRDGTLATPLKGNMYKGPFHIPRMYMVCSQMLGELER